MKRRILYLPIETTARELLGKMLLAAKAVERGWIVFVGMNSSVRDQLGQGAPGAYIEISVPEHKAERLARARARGHRIANLCEEGIIYLSAQDYCTRKVGPSSLATVDLVLVPGRRNAEHLRNQRPECHGKIVLSGNPRFDTLLPGLRIVYEHEAEAIRRRLGRFLLINTNFGFFNPYEAGQDFLTTLERRDKVTTQAHAELIRRLVAYKARHMKGLQSLLAEIVSARAFDHIVVRPHPVENHNVWRQWGAPLGIDVVYEGNANVWMLAANTILHTGCTTGIEGFLLDRPTVSYVPEPDNEFLNLADAVSVHVADAQELLTHVANWRVLEPAELRSRFAGQRANLHSFIENVEPPLATDRILDALEQLDVPEVASVDTARRCGTLKPTLHQRIGKWRAMLREDIGRSRQLQKFPRLDKQELRNPVTQWMEAGIVSRVPNVEQVGDRLWMCS